MYQLYHHSYHYSLASQALGTTKPGLIAIIRSLMFLRKIKKEKAKRKKDLTDPSITYCSSHMCFLKQKSADNSQHYLIFSSFMMLKKPTK